MIIQDTRYKHRQLGITLIELMIALVLASLIMLGVINLFIGNHQNYRMQEGSSRIQENARFAFDSLKGNIRESGFSGCRTVDKIRLNVIASPLPVPANFTADTMVAGFDGGTGSWLPALPASLNPSDVVPGTDVIRIQQPSSCGGTLTGSLASTTANIPIFTGNSCNFNAGDLALISDCTDAHVFTVASAAGDITHTTPFCKSYDAAGTSCLVGKLYDYDAEVMRFDTKTYYIGKRDGLDTANPPALFEQTNNDAAIELVEGVDDMEILYGLDTIGSGGTTGDDVQDGAYVPADVVADWSQVVSVRISILAASISDNILDTVATADPMTPDGVTTLTPALEDKQLRRQFTTTISLRNKVQ